MRATQALLAVSLAANLAWVMTWALSDSAPAIVPEHVEALPAGAPAPTAAGPVLAARPGGGTTARLAPAAAEYRPPWVLRSTPPPLGDVPVAVPGAQNSLPIAPTDRLAARLGRAPTAEEQAALERMTIDSASGAADHLAQEIAGRVGRDGAIARGAGPLFERLASQRGSKQKEQDVEGSLLDFVAGRDFEAAFPVSGYGPKIAWDLVQRRVEGGTLVDGTIIVFEAGEHDLDVYAVARALEYRPFPRDITLQGAGPTKTLLRVSRGLRATGPIVNFVFAGMSVAVEGRPLMESSTNDPVCVRFANCRIAARDGIELSRSGALWFDECEMDGAWGKSSGRPIVQRADDALVRFDRCVVTLSPPFGGVRAAVLRGCTLREQQPRTTLAGETVRLVETLVQPLATQELWNERSRMRRELTVDAVSTGRR